MVWLTVVLEMIVLLEYIDLLIIQGCEISGQAIAGQAVAVPPALYKCPCTRMLMIFNQLSTLRRKLGPDSRD